MAQGCFVTSQAIERSKHNIRATMRVLAFAVAIGLNTALAFDGANFTFPGAYTVKTATYTYADLDRTSTKIHVWYPVGSDGQKFPFIEYAHGNGCGGPQLPLLYNTLLTHMAAYGYVIAAHEACDSGCSDHAVLPYDPVGFKNYYKQQLMVIEWAKKQVDPVFSSVDWSVGVGVSGHSMGGQSTVYSASSAGAGHDIKAAVPHHAYT